MDNLALNNIEKLWDKSIESDIFKIKLHNSLGISRQYSIPTLLAFRQNLQRQRHIYASEIYPNLPILVIRDSKWKETRTNMKNMTIPPLSLTPLNKQLELETFAATNISHSNSILVSDLCAFTYNMPHNIYEYSEPKYDKLNNFKYYEHKRHSKIKQVHEPLTSRTISRLKQIAISKSLPEYKNYIAAVPIEKRPPNAPHTPKHDNKISRREFDRMYREWRVKLHEYSSDLMSTASTRVQSASELNHSLDSI
ncbi:hypothetical protein ACR3K2_24280 [Cryptosporidium serpentis]